MASASSSRESSNSVHQSQKSSSTSQASSIAEARHIRSNSPSQLGACSIEIPTGNGLITPPSESYVKTPRASSPYNWAEKPSMTKRITRMFTKDPVRTDMSLNTPTIAACQALGRSDLASPLNLSTKSPSRKTSVLETPNRSEHQEKSSPSSLREKRAPSSMHQRFVTNSDVTGGHQHHLKSAKRQEKLMDILRSVISCKTRIEPAPEGEQQLSLMSNWVDQLKSEREAMTSEKKGGINTATTLVEKYGKCQEIVGRGAFGIVRISHKRTEGLGEQLYAVKEFRRRPDETEKKYSKRLTSEFCISSSLRHPNVIHTLDLLQDSKGDYCEVMEFCAGGDLYTLVLSAGRLEMAEADCYFKQMMRGVEYMHEMGVAHRDLKPENLLLTTHGSLKITDFGNGECFRMAWESDAHMVTGLCGSAPYIAPEEYTDKEFDARAVDVWATGVIYMAMRTGRHLWRVAKKDEDEFYERYLQGRRDEEGYAPIESLHKARCRNVIYSILDPNPARRITASQVLKSEWGREIQLCKAGEEGL
ncbi:unnamed protein product [Blumeria hordei]|uniref:non-specific serine/threonine protein kinase n=2 Tax=Blumeria hordei TaxID=2867405 RepID=A0A383UUP2_BLUHO|nr:serine/threonine protein kinase [Blumeria hordei DH14]SZF04063.1 unnamed protein product [Blumeria hordei]